MISRDGDARSPGSSGAIQARPSDETGALCRPQTLGRLEKKEFVSLKLGNFLGKKYSVIHQLCHKDLLQVFLAVLPAGRQIQ